jgi:hypothetical protein
MAEVASQRIDQMQDPELSINQAIVDYKRLGYSDRWINQRIKSIEVRKELTDEWKRTGVHEGMEYALLTDIITQVLTRGQPPCEHGRKSKDILVASKNSCIFAAKCANLL